MAERFRQFRRKEQAINHAHKRGAYSSMWSPRKVSTQILGSHLIAFKLGFRNLAQTPFATFMTVLAIGIALSLPLGLHALLKNVQSVASHFEYQGSLTLYLDHNTPQPEILSLQAKIKEKYPEILSTAYISADKALDEFKQQVDIDNILALLPENPLTDMVIVQLDPSLTQYQQAMIIKNALSTFPFVTSVDLDYEWVEKLHAIIRLGKVLSNCLGILIGLGVVFIIGNTMRLALEKHKEELEVLNLIGATRAFIRRPFLYRGLFYGILGAIIGALIISAATLVIKEPAQTLTHLYDGVISIQALKLSEILSLCFYSCLLGWFGAWLAFYQQQKTLA